MCYNFKGCFSISTGLTMLKNRNHGLCLLIAAAVLSSSALSGCKILDFSTGNETAENGFGYLRALSKPADLRITSKNNLKFTRTYRVDLSKTDSSAERPVGDQIDIRSPVQLYSSVPNSYVANDGNLSTVWLNDLTPGSDEYLNRVWNDVLGFLSRRGIGIESTDLGQKKISTEWFITDTVMQPYTPGKAKEEQRYARQKYNLYVVRDYREQKIGVSAELTNFKLFEGENRLNVRMDQFAMNRYTRSFINQIMADYERQTDEERERARTEIEISMLEGDHGVQGWEVGASYDTVWDVLLRMLPEYGFKISESEKIRGSIIVSYDEPSASFWREKGIDPFAIDEDDYRIEVGLADGKTTIQFFDDDNVRLQPDTVERLYFRFANALAESFRQVTSKAVRVSGR